MFIDAAPEAKDKTFLLNLVLADVRSTGKFTLAIASFGVAATILDGDRTTQATFKCPLKYSTGDVFVAFLNESLMKNWSAI